MAKNRRSARFIASKLRKPGKYGDGAGLWFRVSEAKTVGPDGKPRFYRGWFFQFTLHGKEHQFGLGSYDEVSLEQARAKADDARALVKDGVNPIAAKEQKRQAALAAEAARIKELERTKNRTFQRVAEDFILARSAGWKNAKHCQQWSNTLATYVYPIIGSLPISNVSKYDIEDIIRPIFTTKTETASRLRGRIEQILDFAKAKEYRTGDNPAAWKGNLKELLGDITNQKKKVINHARLHYDKLPEFMVKLREREGISAKALEITILTAARTNEVIGMNEAEVDFSEKIWTIPAARMKAKRQHRVPLCDRAIEIMRALPRERNNPFFFVGARRGTHVSNMAMLNLLGHMGYDHITVHGFRGTFKDWAHGANTSASNEEIELALAHTKRDKVEGAYHHDDMLPKRRVLMSKWQSYCSKPPAKVIPMRRSAKR